MVVLKDYLPILVIGLQIAIFWTIESWEVRLALVGVLGYQFFRRKPRLNQA